MWANLGKIVADVALGVAMTWIAETVKKKVTKK